MAENRWFRCVAVLSILIGVVASTSAASATVRTCNGLRATIVGSGTIEGTDGDDVIIGGDHTDDRIFGRGGNDTICSLGGDDRVEGGPGQDWVHSGTGNDTVFGQTGDDELIGGGDNDSIEGGPGEDVVLGRSGDDRVAGGSGDDRVYGERGDDLLFGGPGADALLGGPGDDRLIGNSGDDALSGGSEDDLLDGGSGRDTLRGGGGADTLRGGPGWDRMWGDSGDDVLNGDIDDTLSGGTGFDSCVPISGPTLLGCEAGGGPNVAIPVPPAPDPERDGDEGDGDEGHGGGFDAGEFGDGEFEDGEFENGNGGPSDQIGPFDDAPGAGTIDDIGRNDQPPGSVAGANWWRNGMPVPVAGLGELWVSPSGDDNNPGTEDQPLQSIQLAVDRATPGTTIYLMDGRWEGRGRSGFGYVTITEENSGEPGRWLRLVAAPGATPHIVIRQGEGIRVEGHYVEISGLRIEGIDGGPGDPATVNGPHYGYGILIPHISPHGHTTPAHHVVVTNNEVSGFSISGIATDGANWVVVGGNEVYGNSNWGAEGGSGISFLEHSDAGGGDPGVTTGWITNNLVYDNRQLVNSTKIGFETITDGNCIILDRMDFGPGKDQRVLISENTVTSCGGRGVNVFRSSNVTIERNLSFHNGQTPSLPGEVYGDGDNIVWRKNTMVPRPGRLHLVGAGENENNQILASETSLDDARSQHRSHTGAQTP